MEADQAGTCTFTQICQKRRCNFAGRNTEQPYQISHCPTRLLHNVLKHYQTYFFVMLKEEERFQICSCNHLFSENLSDLLLYFAALAHSIFSRYSFLKDVIDLEVDFSCLKKLYLLIICWRTHNPANIGYIK